ncbi:hypothetical protein BDV27DRAFT_169140 [Aspergillus caelatus]|uniref:Alcohol dehydrogenase-like C-terminal domain-containing protein n=1 Tax=Aspergillus caelatus TaxID=61420 RepID=A0A5N6ZPD8_9EURO|nr:uncharacterized protein BDV27DRAFT_169140 [Aspergillus caelatus]KAE8358826.1 hypothetical protein BDV27DRAFT_169140 [Aspergillus caelatus]
MPGADGTFAEHAKVPLENCIPLDKARLCDDLGYSLQDLAYIAFLLVPYGGLRDIKVEPGDTIIICPATGFYSSLGVQVAIAMGAKVIAMGRNQEKLVKLKDDIRSRSPGANIETVQITGNEDQDVSALKSHGTIDAVLDIRPLRRGGRISIMGSTKNIAVPEILVNNITLKGKMMYEREAVVSFVKMLQSGLFPQGKGFVETKVFQLEDWKDGFDKGAEHNGIGKCVVFAP